MPVEPTHRIAVVVVATTRLYREGLAAVLEASARVRILATASGVRGGVTQIDALRPDVALVDAALSAEPGAMRALVTAAAPAGRVVAFGVGDCDEVVACAEAGVAGYVEREASVAECVSALDAIARDEVLCPPWMAGALLRRVGALARARGEPPALRRLTSREREVMRLVDAGLSNKEIATRLCIALPTVKNHVHNVLDKLHARGRGEAAAQVRALAAEQLSATGI
jgi:DNA-binding NarL/FixJ family response regulator